MSRKLRNGVFLIEGEPDGLCQLCGKVAEVRPYGPNGANVCFTCGMKDEAEAARRFGARIESAGNYIN